MKSSRRSLDWFLYDNGLRHERVKRVNDQCPNNLDEVFQTALVNNIQTRGSFQKLKCPFRKTNAGQMALSYIRPTIWSPLRHLSKQKIPTRLSII